jgi:hypothetical protein
VRGANKVAISLGQRFAVMDVQKADILGNTAARVLKITG